MSTYDLVYMAIGLPFAVWFYGALFLRAAREDGLDGLVGLVGFLIAGSVVYVALSALVVALGAPTFLVWWMGAFPGNH